MTATIPSLTAIGLSLPSAAPFTRQQALAAGVSPTQLRRLLGSGLIRRMLEGVYVASWVPESIELRCAALRLVVPTDAFICDRTAAWLYRGPSALGPNEHRAVPPISCFRTSGHRGLRGRLSASGERAITPADLREINGLVVTTELRTALDLGRLQPTLDLRLWGMDNMLATDAFTLDELLAEIPRFKGERGVVLLRVLAPRSDPLAQSFGESALRNRWYDAGLPRPRLQIPVERDDGTVAYLDMGAEEWLFGAEYDGEEWHSEDADAEHDRVRRRWLSDERGWMVEAFRKDNVFGLRQDAEVRLRRAARAARATLGLRTFIV